MCRYESQGDYLLTERGEEKQRKERRRRKQREGKEGEIKRSENWVLGNLTLRGQAEETEKKQVTKGGKLGKHGAMRLKERQF
jgi:hypothetical protein